MCLNVLDLAVTLRMLICGTCRHGICQETAACSASKRSQVMVYPLFLHADGTFKFTCVRVLLGAKLRLHCGCL